MNRDASKVAPPHNEHDGKEREQDIRMAALEAASRMYNLDKKRWVTNSDVLEAAILFEQYITDGR